MRREILRVIKLYENEVVVCTMGEKSDGSDKTFERFPNAKVETTFKTTYIMYGNNMLKAYKTDEIVCIAK